MNKFKIIYEYTPDDIISFIERNHHFFPEIPKEKIAEKIATLPKLFSLKVSLSDLLRDECHTGKILSTLKHFMNNPIKK